MKKLVILPLVAVVALTACGKKASYKSRANLIRTSKPAINPRAVNTPAPVAVEMSALEMLAQDQAFQSKKDKDAILAIKAEIRGVTLKVETSKMTLHLALKNEGDCAPQKFEKNLTISQIKNFAQFNEKVRLSCVGNSCEQILMIVEDKKMVSGSGEQQIEKEGAVAILLKKEADGLYKPTSNQSAEFYQVNNAEVGLQSCSQEVVRDEEPASPVEQGTPDAAVVPTPATPETPAATAPAAPASAGDEEDDDQVSPTAPAAAPQTPSTDTPVAPTAQDSAGDEDEDDSL
ncbi:MAG: hypothetical protein K2Q26_07205 [Bdellovibrionales bacterium]|nr:hypothetical protein [Bdellovibrionales bacterium]